MDALQWQTGKASLFNYNLCTEADFILFFCDSAQLSIFTVSLSSEMIRGLIVLFSAVMISLKHKTTNIQYKDKKGSNQERGRSVYKATYIIKSLQQIGL